MRLLKKNIFGLILITISFSILFLHIDSATSEKKPKDVVELYLNALSTGDLKTIKKCFGENLLKRRKNTFKDPAYANFLIDHYNGSTFRIIHEQERKNGSKVVDIEITFRSSDTLAIRLILNSNNKIVEEIIL